ncbi:hypothetical protein GCM10023080_017060 [Streptomyces pseudoechinosporeus]
MTYANRRSILAAVAAAATAGPLILESVFATAHAADTADLHGSNTELYADPSLVEGTDYGRRYRRQPVFDDSLATGQSLTKTVVIAPHGGGIETGTSELCLAIAGYHPATLEVTPIGGAVHDYWMFEGLRSSNNAELHVTSTHCDDRIARSLCAGALNAVSLHGCTTSQASLPDGTQAVLVGGLNTTLKQYLLESLTAAGVQAEDASGSEGLGGVNPANIVNRTLLGQGAQLEITTPLRTAMFGTNTRAGRKNTTTQIFWDVVQAVRQAVGRIEAEQTVA